MRKEVFISILIGLIFGLIITYGVYKAKSSEETTTQDVSVDESLTPTPGELNAHKLVIHSPEDEIIQESNKTTVTGTTITNSFVVILINNDETITTADESGNFSVEVDLEDGSNVITVFVLDEDGQKSSTQRVVIVSDQPLEATQSAETKEDEE